MVCRSAPLASMRRVLYELLPESPSLGTPASGPEIISKPPLDILVRISLETKGRVGYLCRCRGSLRAICQAACLVSAMVTRWPKASVADHLPPAKFRKSRLQGGSFVMAFECQTAPANLQRLAQPQQSIFVSRRLHQRAEGASKRRSPVGQSD